MKGLRIGVLRHLYEDDVPVAGRVEGSAGARPTTFCAGSAPSIEDARIRPAADYHAVKITGAESELFAVHEPVLRTRLNDFGEDFLGRALGALLISGRGLRAGVAAAAGDDRRDGARCTRNTTCC